MTLGNKILSLRKKLNLSQEQLAEQLNVTRQTISKWELDETSPNITQAKELSKIFNISLDELTDNDIKDVLVEKVSNTEQLAGMLIKIIKFIGIALLFMLIMYIVAFVLFATLRKEVTTSGVDAATFTCTIEDNDYLISLGSDGLFNCSNCDKKIQMELTDILDFNDIETSVRNIEQHFENKGGSCELK